MPDHNDHPTATAAPDPVVTLAGTDISFRPLGVGTWAWGDERTWGMGSYDAALTEQTIADAWDASIEAGVTLFDTAEVYGNGESERIIGRRLAADPSARSKVVLATKFMPMPWKLNVSTLLRSALSASLDRLGVDHVDLYQIHGPVSLRSRAVLAEALAEVHREGMTRAVGVSNYSVKEMGAMASELGARGLRLATNQIEFSLLRNMPEQSGLMDACATLGVMPLAYSPIGQGRLTGKYSAANPVPKSRNFSAHPQAKVDTVVTELRRIATSHDRTPAQVALRWIIDKGAVPIPGAKNAEQATQNAGGLDWAMTEGERLALERVALRGVRSIANRIWQHG